MHTTVSLRKYHGKNIIYAGKKQEKKEKKKLHGYIKLYIVLHGKENNYKSQAHHFSEAHALDYN